MMGGGKAGLWSGIGLFALAFAVLAWSAYDAASRLLPARDRQASQAEAGDGASVATAQAPQYDISRIIDSHVFGRAQQPGAEQQVQAPETKLQLKLIGVIASGDKRFARAIVGVNGSKVRPYSVGQTIQGTDAAVDAVESRRVLLKRGSALESLALKRKQVDIAPSD